MTRRATVVVVGLVVVAWVALSALALMARIGWVEDDGGCVGNTPTWAILQACVTAVGVLVSVRLGRRLLATEPAKPWRGTSISLLALVALWLLLVFAFLPDAQRAATC